MALNDELRNILEGRYTGFNARFKELKYNWCIKDIDVEGNFYYLTFKDGKVSLDDFIDFIYYKVINFCVPAKERNRLRKLYLETNDDRYIFELTDRARNLFVKSIQQQTTTGEPGELILFILLEAVLNAPQLACKMHLKTNVNMPVHGSDGIHVSYNDTNGELTLYWGESKLYQKLPNALDQVCESIGSFVNEDGGVKPRDRDIQIIKDHIAIDNEKAKDEILKYFDPYEEQSNSINERFACFVGFDFNKLSSAGKMDKKDIEKYFEAEYLKRIETACKLFEEKIRKNNIHKLKYTFFLIPFEDVEEVRTKFLRKLGV